MVEKRPISHHKQQSPCIDSVFFARRKAEEYMRLAEIRGGSSIFAAQGNSGSCKAALCLELAAINCGQSLNRVSGSTSTFLSHLFYHRYVECSAQQWWIHEIDKKTGRTPINTPTGAIISIRQMYSILCFHVYVVLLFIFLQESSIRLSGLNKKIYSSYLKSMETLLDLESKTSIPDLAVQFSATNEAKLLAVQILNK